MIYGVSAEFAGGPALHYCIIATLSYITSVSVYWCYCILIDCLCIKQRWSYFIRLGMAMYGCPLGDAVCLIMQPSLTWEFMLFAVGDWFTALFCMAVYENACFSYWCGNYFQMWWGCRCLPLSLLHTLTHFCGCTRHSFPFSWEGHENWQEEPRDARISLCLCQCMYTELMRSSKSSSRTSWCLPYVDLFLRRRDFLSKFAPIVCFCYFSIVKMLNYFRFFLLWLFYMYFSSCFTLRCFFFVGRHPYKSIVLIFNERFRWSYHDTYTEHFQVVKL